MSTRSRADCAECEGTGVLEERCHNCAGWGVGRSCYACGDTGWIAQECDTCEGTGMEPLEDIGQLSLPPEGLASPPSASSSTSLALLPVLALTGWGVVLAYVVFALVFLLAWRARPRSGGPL